MTYDREKADREHEQYMSRPGVGIAKVGPSRWFWVFWPTHLAQFHGEDPERYGFADSYESAVESCGGIENLKSDSLRSERIVPNAHYALSWRRELAKRRRKPNTKIVDARPVEYVYHHESSYNDYDGSWNHRTCAHRIFKRTRQRIYVEAECASRFTPGHDDERSVVLDRATIESGCSWHVRGIMWGGVDFTLNEESPYEKDQAIPDCFAALELKPPYTERRIKSAFRRLSRKHHPDAGGDAEKFRSLVAEYEKALVMAD
jgi:hypothetical protein